MRQFCRRLQGSSRLLRGHAVVAEPRCGGVGELQLRTLFRRVKDASLPPEQSRDLIHQLAKEL